MSNAVKRWYLTKADEDQFGANQGRITTFDGEIIRERGDYNTLKWIVRFHNTPVIGPLLVRQA